VTSMLGARTAGRAHPDRWALAVLAEVLDKELTEEIRYRRGLVYGLSAYNSFYDDTGYFAVSTQSQRNSVDDIRREVEKSLDRVRRGEIDPQAVAEAKTALKGRRALAMEDNVGRATWLAQWAFVLAGDQPVPDYHAAIDAVAPGDLARVVNTYFTPQRSFAGVHDPVLTVASGARLVGAFLGLGLGAWGLYRLRRSKKRRTAAGAAPHPPDVEPAAQT
jgi:predicted Zn-dependent peptidase